MRSFALVLFAFIGLCLLAACGGGGGGPSFSITTTQAQVAATQATAGTIFGFVFQANSAALLTWSASGLPSDGLTLNTFDGVVSGTPASKASVTFTLTASDAQGHITPPAQFTISVNNPSPPSITTTQAQLVAAPADTEAQYNFAFAATGGLAPLNWMETGPLPSGLSLGSDGVLSGMPTVTGSFPITVMVQDSAGQSATPQNFTLQAIGFTPAGSMATPRSEHTATLLNTHKVLVAGGTDGTNTLASAELYDPVGGGFGPTAGMSVARKQHAATLLGSQKVLVTGGTDGTNASATAELYDATSATFSSAGAMTGPRQSHQATILNDGRVLITGGFDGAAVVASAELYDPVKGTFTLTGAMTSPRQSHTATLLSNGKVLVAGGDDGSTILSSIELYDPVKGTFTAAGNMASPRKAHSATVLNDGTVLLAGGLKLMNIFSQGGPFAFTLPDGSADIYDPVSGTFSRAGNMQFRRSSHSAIMLSDGKVLLAGGTTYFLNELPCRPIPCSPTFRLAIFSTPTTEQFDPMNISFTQTAGTAAKRTAHTISLLNNGEVLAVGGADSQEMFQAVGKGPYKLTSSSSTVLATAELENP